jgi:hypothetical protein
MLSKLVAALALAGAIQPALGLTAEQWKGKTIYQWVSQFRRHHTIYSPCPPDRCIWICAMHIG